MTLVNFTSNSNFGMFEIIVIIIVIIVIIIIIIINPSMDPDPWPCEVSTSQRLAVGHLLVGGDAASKRHHVVTV